MPEDSWSIQNDVSPWKKMVDYIPDEEIDDFIDFAHKTRFASRDRFGDGKVLGAKVPLTFYDQMAMICQELQFSNISNGLRACFYLGAEVFNRSNGRPKSATLEQALAYERLVAEKQYRERSLKEIDAIDDTLRDRHSSDKERELARSALKEYQRSSNDAVKRAADELSEKYN
ncbi:hypothetical protein [Neptunomonas sp.]|uniref:hypothetical protein n=1 Tax=Neptunomonas sp. TaxID=1971898 RepID=UPI00356813AF